MKAQKTKNKSTGILSITAFYSKSIDGQRREIIRGERSSDKTCSGCPPVLMPVLFNHDERTGKSRKEKSDVDS